jgi:hypothetical protein
MYAGTNRTGCIGRAKCPDIVRCTVLTDLNFTPGSPIGVTAGLRWIF